MVIGASGRDPVTPLHDDGSHRPGVIDHITLINLELGIQRFLERNGLRGDRVHQRATLGARENDGVEDFFHFFIAIGKNDASARSAQGFVGGGCHYVRMRQRVRIQACGNQAGHVRHVHQEPCTD